MTRIALTAVFLLGAGCSLDYDAIPRGGAPGFDAGPGGDGIGFQEPCIPGGDVGCAGDLVCGGVPGSERCFAPCRATCRWCFGLPPEEVCAQDCAFNSPEGCGAGDWCGLAYFDNADGTPIAVLACYGPGDNGQGGECFEPSDCSEGHQCIHEPFRPPTEPGMCAAICRDDVDCDPTTFCVTDAFIVDRDGRYGFCEPR